MSKNGFSGRLGPYYQNSEQQDEKPRGRGPCQVHCENKRSTNRLSDQTLAWFQSVASSDQRWRSLIDVHVELLKVKSLFLCCLKAAILVL
ncbi:hypothetical protein DTO012A7_2463 [Penicillium roqueforti]|nr:hypothetical protein DTO012A7_2463 [Penicillium roqueforti]